MTDEVKDPKEPKKPVREKKDEVAQITPEEIRQMREQMQALQAQNKELTSMVMQTADKKQLANWFGRHAKKIPTQVTLAEWRGKVVVGWSSMIANNMEKNPMTQVWHEELKTKIIFEDGTSEEVQYPIFAVSSKRVAATVVKTMRDEETKHVDLALKLNDSGREVTVGLEFINP